MSKLYKHARFRHANLVGMEKSPVSLDEKNVEIEQWDYGWSKFCWLWDLRFLSCLWLAQSFIIWHRQSLIFFPIPIGAWKCALSHATSLVSSQSRSSHWDRVLLNLIGHEVCDQQWIMAPICPNVPSMFIVEPKLRVLIDWGFLML